jgi:xanthine dehydrogenase accessory factor
MDQFFREVVKALEANREFVIGRIVEAQGSTPGKVGFKMLIFKDGATYGTLGGGSFEKRAIEESLKLFEAGERTKMIDATLEASEMLCGGQVKVFLEKYEAGRKLYIFGGGHVGKALASIASIIKIPTVIIDDRKEFANKERFPHSEIVIGRGEECAKTIDFKNGFVVIVTRSHEQDYEILSEILKRDEQPFYMGMMGSQSKVNTIFNELKQSIDQEKLREVHAPIGIDINSETAEEIAVSIIAEIIKEKKFFLSKWFFIRRVQLFSFHLRLSTLCPSI